LTFRERIQQSFSCQKKTTKMKTTNISKFLSLILRHQPEVIGIQLDKNGWADVEELLEKMNTQGKGVDRAMLEKIVENNSKQRFAFSEDKRKIRANQGHSVAVDLEFTPAMPPTLLYHGTAERFLVSILEQGLQKRSRQHVHLSTDRATAVMVGKRHGKAVVLVVSAGEMYKDGYEFYHSENGYWLTDHIPTQYLKKQVVDEPDLLF